MNLEHKICRRCHTERDISSFHKTRRSKDGHQPWCAKCDQEWRLQHKEQITLRRDSYRSNHSEKIKAQKKRSYQKNIEKIRVSGAKYRLANSEKRRSQQKVYYSNNKNRRVTDSRTYRLHNKEKVRAVLKAWATKNPEKINALSARRRSTKLMAMPAWANQFFIEEIYDLAQRRTALMGYEWHVDHTVPLQSSIVCGLHVEHNLRVIPAVQNMSKHNRYWPDMPKEHNA